MQNNAAHYTSVVSLSVSPSQATGVRNDVQSNFHSLEDSTGPVQTAMTLAAMREAHGDLATTGLLIHRLGDSFAHCPDRGKCFETGWGHGIDSVTGVDPDVIQNRPEQYLDYAETLVGALAQQQGKSADEIKALRASIRNELSDVAGIDRYDRPAKSTWKPSGWMDSPPPKEYRAIMGAKRLRSNSELQALSEQTLQQKLIRQGAKGSYSPEKLPGAAGVRALYLPDFLPGPTIGRTLDQALADFTRATGMPVNKEEALAALARLGQLVEAQRASERGEPAVAVEGASGNQTEMHMQGGD